MTLYSARTSPVYVKQDDASGTTTVFVRMAIASKGYEPSKVYGAPAAIVLRLVVQHEASADAAAPPRVAATVWLVNKTATRMPESTFLAFHPDDAAAKWEISKLGSWEAPVPGWVVAGGSKHLHAVRPRVAARASPRRRDGKLLTIEMVDASIVNLGAPNAFPVPTVKMDDPWNAEPDLAGHGVSSLVHSNNWGTNCPFRKDGADVADEQTIVARYNVRF